MSINGLLNKTERTRTLLRCCWTKTWASEIISVLLGCFARSTMVSPACYCQCVQGPGSPRRVEKAGTAIVLLSTAGSILLEMSTQRGDDRWNDIHMQRPVQLKLMRKVENNNQGCGLDLPAGWRRVDILVHQVR